MEPDLLSEMQAILPVGSLTLTTSFLWKALSAGSACVLAAGPAKLSIISVREHLAIGKQPIFLY